ncbi:MAG: tRNA (N(6)-L-threonylcarbamoyladenosine(37)-C(2))-methylthiotransferase MtaB [Bacilli bacterium]|nr:tRNA (N(6)-L-threonylcarbamoyladenosine(37)-C(2))-methylthiotransferase MtaB [Bacilli bacterium]
MKVAFYTLGCKVNLYETQAVLNSFKNKNYEIVAFEDKADIYVINTCTVTHMSASKSRKIIRSAIKKNEDAIVVVMGCYAQMNSSDVKEMLGVNIVVGTNDRNKIVSLVEEYIKTKQNVNIVGNIDDIPFEDMEVSFLEGKTRAFVKIEDGCNNYCSYCIIPYTRGSVRSKKKDLVLKEITNLVSNGYREVVLTGIHTGNYGSDFKDYTFANLLSEVIKIKGLERLRISSIEITELNDDVLDILKNSKVIANHLHIPLQAGSDDILVAMNRKYNKEYFRNKINQIRLIRNDIAITTDVIVGFPGESDAHFKETYDFIKEIGFAGLHVFPYSKREGTKAATMDNQIDKMVKKDRVHQLMKLSLELERNYMMAFKDKTVSFIAETYENGYLIGHSSNYLKIKALGEEHNIGCMLTATIKKIEYPYCIATIIKHN